jgi:hypothetical protein
MSNRRSSFQALTDATGAHLARAEMRQMQQEAGERGVSVLLIEREHLEAERVRRQADAAHVQTLLADPATLRALRAQSAPRTRLPDGTFPPLPSLPQPAPAEPPAPPRFDSAAFAVEFRHTFNHWPSFDEYEDERLRLARGERSIFAPPPSAGKIISPPRVA